MEYFELNNYPDTAGGKDVKKQCIPLSFKRFPALLDVD
jgi:hypothetical protein